MTEVSPAEELFFAALDRPPADRAAYLDAACAGKPELRAWVERLLAAHPRVSGFLEPGPGVTGTYPAGTPTAGAPAADTPAGTVVAGRYKLLQPIGEGGMGTVWMADQTEPVRRRVAFKLIRTEKGGSRAILSRFEAERQAIALMDHPHIAKLLDAGSTDAGQPFFVMELVKGVPLTEFCDAHRLTVPDRLSLFVQICSAVQHAHQKGVIHRDLKPTNVLVESHDGKPVPKVIDFGLAKATSGLQLSDHTLFTAFGSVMGTPLYMAPEQAAFNAVDVDTRADIYALGVILYELLTGTTPIARETLKKAALDEMLRLVREQDAPSPSSRLSASDGTPAAAANRQTEPAKLGRFVKGELDWIVLKALAKERDRRYESASGFARDVERFLAHEPVTAGPPTAAYRLRKFVRRNRGRVAAASLLLGVVLLGLVATSYGFYRAELERQRAEGAERSAVRNALAAMDAAEAERKTKREADAKRWEAERNRAFALKGIDVLGSVFAGLDLRAEYATVAELRNALRANLARTVRELDTSVISDPLVVAALQRRLGTSLLALGEANLAIDVFGKELATRKGHQGADHPDTFATMNNLGMGYLDAGRHAQALPLLEKVLAVHQAEFGLDHPGTLQAMNNLGTVYSRMKRLDQSVPLFEKLLPLRERNLGRGHPETLATAANLGVCYKDAGRPAEAIPFLLEAYRAANKHPLLRPFGRSLLDAYRKAGKSAEAGELLDELIADARKRLPAGSPQLVQELMELSMVLLRSDAFVEVEPLLGECLAVREKSQPDLWNTFNARSMLGGALLGQKKYADAEPLLLTGYEGMKRREKTIPVRGSGHLFIPEALDRLAGLYTAWGRPAEAARWRAERAKYPPEAAPRPRSKAVP